MTVEAALLMPLILFVVFSLIYLAFYLHDISRIQGIVDDALKKASLSFKHDSNFITGETNYANINERGAFYLITGSTKQEEETLQKYLQNKLSRGLFITKISGIQTEANKWRIYIRVNVEISISTRGVMNFFDPIAYKIIDGTCSIHNPAETIRMTEVILNTGQKIKGMDAMKKKLEKVKDKIKGK